VKIYLGCDYCIPLSTDSVDLTCTFTNSCVGLYKPIVRTNLGDLTNDVNVTNIQVFMEVISISPNSVNNLF
jgi:ribosomal protein S3AE